MKRFIVVVIVSLLALLVSPALVVFFSVTPGESGESHVLSVVDPMEVEHKISSDQAIQIIENAGYVPPENFSIMLVKDENLYYSPRENFYWMIEWGENLTSILVDANEGRIVEIWDLNAYESEPKVVTESNAAEIAREKVEKLTKIPAELGTPEVSVLGRNLGTTFKVEWLQETDTYGRGRIYVELDPAGNLISFLDTWRG